MSNLQGRQNKTSNDIAWKKIFQEYPIIKIISNQGFFEIDSPTINRFRESRLMAKFDHYDNLPAIFKTHNLSILPTSRSKYIIGYFDTYLSVNYDGAEAISVEFPAEIESIDHTKLYSETSALSCAFNTGIIKDLLDDGEVFYTVSGRMSTSNFTFCIRNLLSNIPYEINVDNSQCEIDAGFETNKYFLLVEAKLYEVNNFLVRQLYYPYRLWSSKLSKEVVPALMTYSNLTSTFTFFIYKFDNVFDYNSIRLIAQKDYVIAPEGVQREEISEIFSSISIVPEPSGIPFPQANEFERVVDLATLLLNRDLTKEEITINYKFDARQTTYYADAARYLGLVDKYSDPVTKEVTFCLTREGRSLFSKRHKIKIVFLIKKILQPRVFYEAFNSTLKIGVIPQKDEIGQIMLSCNLGLNFTTISRRSSTVRGWIEWIFNMLSD